MYGINILRNGSAVNSVSIKYALPTGGLSDRGLRTEYKTRTEFKTIKTSVKLCVVIAFESNRVQNNYPRGLYSAMVSLCPKFKYRVATGN